jgi:hypothetical protein
MTNTFNRLQQQQLQKDVMRDRETALRTIKQRAQRGNHASQIQQNEHNSVNTGSGRNSLKGNNIDLNSLEEVSFYYIVLLCVFFFFFKYYDFSISYVAYFNDFKFLITVAYFCYF